MQGMQGASPAPPGSCEGEEICILLNDAYDLLSDPEEKEERINFSVHEFKKVFIGSYRQVIDFSDGWFIDIEIIGWVRKHLIFDEPLARNHPISSTFRSIVP